MQIEVSPIVVSLLFAICCELKSRLSSHQSLSSQQSESTYVPEQNPIWLQLQQEMRVEAAINRKSNDTRLATKLRGQHALTSLESHNCTSKFSTAKTHPASISRHCMCSPAKPFGVGRLESAHHAQLLCCGSVRLTARHARRIKPATC